MPRFSFFISALYKTNETKMKTQAQFPKSLFHVLFDHDDGLSFVVLEVIKNLKNHVNKPQFQTNGWFINQQYLRTHN